MRIKPENKWTYTKEECPSCHFDKDEKPGDNCILVRGHKVNES